MALFSFKAAALAVRERGVSSCKNFALNFLLRNPLDQGASRRKRVQKFLQKGWAAQGFKAKKRLKAEPAAAPQGSQPIKAKTLGYSSYKTPFLDTALQLGLGF